MTTQKKTTFETMVDEAQKEARKQIAFLRGTPKSRAKPSLEERLASLEYRIKRLEDKVRGLEYAPFQC